MVHFISQKCVSLNSATLFPAGTLSSWLHIVLPCHHLRVILREATCTFHGLKFISILQHTKIKKINPFSLKMDLNVLNSQLYWGFSAGLRGLLAFLIISFLQCQTPYLVKLRGEPDSCLNTAQFLAFREVKRVPRPHLWKEGFGSFSVFKWKI
jgi:hypothetical protein